MSLRAISYGGGVQSTALVVLAAQGTIDFPLAIFANVGETSEHPATLDYVRNIAMPWAADRGVEVVEIHKMLRGHVDDLRVRVMDETMPKSIPIPVRMSRQGSPGVRSCTKDYKILPVARELKRRGATPADPATVAIGISVDEIERATSSHRNPVQTRTYPLLELGLNRSNCEQIIRDAGLPVPIKSACYFCPFHRPQVWAEMRRDEPEMFELAAEVEDSILSQRAAVGRDPVYLSQYGRPIREAITEAQAPLFATEGPEQCDEGYCWT